MAETLPDFPTPRSGNAPRQARAEFFIAPQLDPKASREAGRPIHRDVEMVRLRFAGDNKRVHEAPAHERFKMDREHGGMVTYAQEFPREYEAFQRGQEQLLTGTRIEMLPGLTPSKIADLKGLNVVTVEQLAALPDRAFQRLGMGARALVDQARDFLAEAEGHAATNHLREENTALRSRLDDMERALAELRNQPLAPREDEAEAGDAFEAMTVADLKTWLADRGIPPKASAKKAELADACRQIAEQLGHEVVEA